MLLHVPLTSTIQYVNFTEVFLQAWVARTVLKIETVLYTACSKSKRLLLHHGQEGMLGCCTVLVLVNHVIQVPITTSTCRLYNSE